MIWKILILKKLEMLIVLTFLFMLHPGQEEQSDAGELLDVRTLWKFRTVVRLLSLEHDQS